MANLSAAPSLSTIKVGQFKGADFSVPEDQIKPYRAAQSENMMPHARGEVRKRPGILWEKSMENYLLDGGHIVNMIGGKHPVVKRTVDGREWYETKIVAPAAGISVIRSDFMPTVVPYGEKYFIFMTDSDGNLYNTFSYDEKATLIILADTGHTIYTDAGIRYYQGADTNWVWNQEVIRPDDENLTTPTVLHGCDPAGGGSPFQMFNLLNPWVTESFCCTHWQTSVFYLQSDIYGITDWNVRKTGTQIADKIMVEVLHPIEEKEGEGSITVCRWVKRPLSDVDGYRPAANRIYLDPAGNKGISYTKDNGETVQVDLGTEESHYWIPATPKEGEDNVRITHWRSDFAKGFMTVCQCMCGTTFGVGNYKDRLFLGGNNRILTQYGAEGHRNRIYYSEMEDPLYIGDLNYIEAEQGCDVMAMNGIDDILAIITDREIIFAQAAAQDVKETGYVTDARFTISAKTPAPPPANYNNTAVLGGEVVYLSTEGVIAIAYKEHFDERFAEHRSALIERELLKDMPQRLISLGRFLLIQCKNGVCWVLDEDQPNNEGNKPYSSHQYEGYRLTGMYMDYGWAEKGVLKLVYGQAQFYWSDGSTGDQYHNEYGGAGTETAIKAWWETPWIYGTTFYRKKIFMKLGMLLDIPTWRETASDGSVRVATADTSILVEGKKNDEDWKILWNYDGTLCSFDYDNIDYRLFTYSEKPGVPDITRKIKIKKAMCLKLRFTNDFVNQAFILRGYGLDYVQED